MKQYLREVGMDYQTVLDNNQVYINTSEANYSLVFHKRFDTPADANRAYQHIKFDLARGRSIYDACGITPDDLSEHVRKWEAKRLERMHK